MKFLLLLVVVVAVAVAFPEPQKRDGAGSANGGSRRSSIGTRGSSTGGLQKRDGDWWSGESFWPRMSWGNNRGYYGGYNNYNAGFGSAGGYGQGGYGQGGYGQGGYGGQYGGRSRPYSSGGGWSGNFGSYPWYAMWGDDNNWSGEWFSDRLGVAAPTGTGRSASSGRSAGRPRF